MTVLDTRPTAVEWAGSLPAAWEECRAKFLFDRLRLPPGDDDGVVTAFRDGQVTLRENRRTDGFTFATKEIGYQGVRVGHLVIHSMDGFAGAIGVSESSGKCSPVYVICDPKPGAEARYYAYVLRHMALSGYITSLAKGIRERSTSFGWGEFKEQWLPAPTTATQMAIADFLDRKTESIDTLIEKKKKHLDLLADKRVALINQAVTQGLDPSVPMKDSGVSWIGETPAHWAVKRLKFACVLQRGFDLPSQARIDGDVPVYGGGGITGRHNQAMVAPPGVVTGRYGTVGEVHLVDVPFWPLNTSLYVKEFWGNNAAYIRHLLSVVPMKMYSAKSAVPGVDRNDVHVIPVGLPPVSEQNEIVAVLDTRLGELDRVSASIKAHVERLQEYRQALITAAVTGQLDIGEGTP